MCLPGTAAYLVPRNSCSNGWRNLVITRTVSSVTHTVTVTRSVSFGVLPRTRRAVSETFVPFLCGSVLLSGSSVATALQKLQAVQTLSSCSDGANLGPADFSSSPTQMQLGSDSARYVRGLVVGNSLLWLGCIAAAVAPLLLLLWRRRQALRAEPLHLLAGSLGMPGKLVVPFSMLAVPSATGATQLLVLGISTGLGWICIAACCVGIALVVAFTTVRFRALAVPRRRVQASLVHRLQQLFLPVVEWVDSKDSLGFANRWRPLFEAYVQRSQWFLGAELFVAIATAVLAGLVPADGNVTVCANLQKASCFLSLCFFAVVASKRPYSVPFDFWLAVLNAGLTALSCVLGLIDVDTVDLSNAQIGLNFAGTVVFLLSFLLEGNLNKLNGRIVRVLRGDAPRHRSASNIEADPSPVPHQTLVELAARNALAEQHVHLSDRNAMLEHLVNLICSNNGHA